MRTPLLASLCLPLITALIAAGAPAAHAQPRNLTPVQSKIFTSRAALAAALGQPIAQQVPADVDLGLFALVWVKLPIAPGARVKIVTLPADAPLRYAHSSAQQMTLTRKGPRLEVSIMEDSPCMGGMEKPPEQAAACHRSLEANMNAAKQTQVLFATPRARLRRVVATRFQAPPRP